MAARQFGWTSRTKFHRALVRSGLEVRHHGGELLVVCPYRHLRIGARDGIGPIMLEKLLRQLEQGGVASERIRALLAPRGW